MANFDLNQFVAQKSAQNKKAGGFDVDAFVASKTAAPNAGNPGTFDVASFVSSKGVPQVVTPDLNTVEGLAAQGKLLGLEDEVNKILDATPKMSFLQRVGSALGAFNPAEAILVGKEKGVGAGLVEYPKDILLGLAGAISGTDYVGDRRFFSDVVTEFGIKNSIAKFGIGLVGDILLDPTTYFGGAIARGAIAGTKVVSESSLKTLGKAAPEIEQAIRLSAGAMTDAFGKTFSFGYGTTKGLSERFLEIQTKLIAAKEEAVIRNLSQLGTDVLAPSQQSELVYNMLSAKRAEFGAGKGTEAGAKAAQEAITTTDPIVRAAIEKKAIYSQELSRLAGIEDPFTIYFPSLKKENIDNFINATRQLRVGSEAYKKQFRDLLTDEELVMNPAEAFATREYQVMKDLIVKEELGRIVQDFGVPVSTFADETAAKAAGYTPIFEKGSPIGFYKGEYAPAEAILKQIELQLTSNGVITAPQVLEQSFIKVGQAIEFAREVGLKVAQKSLPSALGRATLGGIDKPGGMVNLKAFTSETMAHELGHSFDTKLSGVINSKRSYQKELAGLVKKTGLGGSEQYKAKATERFAEYVSLYIHNPGRAKKLAPEFTEHFETNLLQEEKFGDFISRLGDFFQKVDGLPNIKTKLDGLGGGNYLQTAIRTAFPRKQFVGVRNIKPLGFIKEQDKQFLDGLTNDKLTSIDMLAKATGFDAITSLFKRAVTGLFAPFHIRNYVSGMIQNFEVLGVDALNPANISAGQKIAYWLATDKAIPEGQMLLGGKAYDAKMLVTKFKDRFGGSSSYIADIADATRGAGNIPGKILSKASVKTTLKTAGLGQQAIPFRAARAVGNFIETQQKATAYITALNQGSTVDEALKLATLAGFDYRALTPFESKIMRRIVPFYSYARKNIELQLTTLGTHPERINQVLALARNTGSLLGGGTTTAEERQNLPDFLKASLGIRVADTPEGLRQYIANFGTPVEAFTDLISTNPVLKAISMMNPLLKAPLEIGIGKDSFRQKDLKDVYDAREYKLAPQVVKDLLQITPVEKPILKKTPAGELEQVGTRTVYVANPVRLLIARSLFTSRGVSYLDQVFGGDLEGLTQAIRLTTGIKPVQVDIEAQAGIKEKEKKDALKDLLIRRGNLAQYTNVYVPKGR